MSSYDKRIQSLDEPLVERRIYRLLTYLGLIALMGTLVIYVMELVIFPPYIQVILTEGILPSLVYNEQLNLIHSMDLLLIISIGLGFFGIFAKYGKKSGYIFFLLFVFPIFSLQEFFVDLLMGFTSIDESLIWYVSAMSPAIGKSLILAVILYLSLESIIDKRIIGLVSLTFVVSQVSQVVWYFSTRHLAPVYDFVNWTAEGSIGNTLLICIPVIIGAIACAIVFAALFVSEIRKDRQSVEESSSNSEVIDNTLKEIVISQ